MTPLESPPVAIGLAEAIHEKLRGAAAPLKLADVAKGLPKPRKMKAPELQQEVQKVLDEEIRVGRAFSAPSGKNQETRYWSRDERQMLRDRAAELAATPQPLSSLMNKLAREAKGTDRTFVDAVVREMIGASHLFEHPQKNKSRPPLLASWAPPPPLPTLELSKHRRAVEKLADACRKLMAAAGVDEDELFRALRARLGEAREAAARPRETAEEPRSESGMREETRDELRPSEAAPEASQAAPEMEGVLEGLILKAVANAPELSLAELRGEMPEEFRGQAFDEAVLRLAEARRVVVSSDTDPARFSEAERGAFVRDGDRLLSTISAGR
jgi:hypothetical protein